jgi:two-component SAPR family response regulator
MISCVAIDDEPLALVVLQDYIGKVPTLELKRSFTDAFAALDFLKKEEVSLVFRYKNATDNRHTIIEIVAQTATGNFYYRVQYLCRGRL